MTDTTRALESPYTDWGVGIGIETYVIHKIAMRSERGIKFAYVLLESEISKQINSGSQHANTVATKEALKVLHHSDWIWEKQFP
jgi:hypothetical protein